MIQYLAIEGRDQGGKTTLVNHLKKAAGLCNYELFVTQEPSSYLRSDANFKRSIQSFSDKLLYMLIDDKGWDENDYQELAQSAVDLFKQIHADRLKVTEPKIRNFLWNNRNGLVVSDRSVLSSIIYQFMTVYILLGSRIPNRFDSIYYQLINNILNPIDEYLNPELHISPHKYIVLFGPTNPRPEGEGETSKFDSNQIINDYIQTMYLYFYIGSNNTQAVKDMIKENPQLVNSFLVALKNFDLAKVHLINTASLSYLFDDNISIQTKNYKLLNHLGLQGWLIKSRLDGL